MKSHQVGVQNERTTLKTTRHVKKPLNKRLTELFKSTEPLVFVGSVIGMEGASRPQKTYLDFAAAKVFVNVLSTGGPLSTFCWRKIKI